MSSSGIRRNREKLACRECRRRKLRCDRNTPCGSCVRRRDGASCSYSLHHEGEHQAHAEARLEHLEQLVQQLAAQHVNASAEPNVATATAIPASHPIVEPSSYTTQGVNGPRHPTYSGGHWAAMLEDIQALRSTIHSFTGENTAGEVDEPRAVADVGIGMIFGTGISQAFGIEEILNRYLPSRKDTDRLTSAYFRAPAVAAPFVHSAQFRRQYQSFWTNPQETPVLWTSILFSILYIATNSLTLGRDIESIDNDFAIATAQCLALGEYYRPQRFAVEALMLYTQSLCITSLEIPPDIGSAFGVLIRLATSMGYHRDPELSGFSPFEKEIRRRTWSACMQIELMISFHLGIPSGIQSSTWDTRAPRNLFDFDFDEDTIELPPPRPDTDLTGVLFYNIKHRFMAVFGDILQHVLTTRTHEHTESDAITLDTQLKEVYGSLPKVLQTRPIAESVVDPPNLITTRLCVSAIFYKCLCVLHRPYVARSRIDSVATCYTAASALVRDTLEAYDECKPGGQLETDQWFMTSITWHDLLLGAATLCMVLCATNQGVQNPQIDILSTLTLLARARAAVSARLSTGKSIDRARVLLVIDATMNQFGRQGTEEATLATAIPAPSELSVEERPSQSASDWSWTGSEIGILDNTNWAYLEQFLDLPNNETSKNI